MDRIFNDPVYSAERWSADALVNKATREELKRKQKGN
jgi:hypothetical protein